MALEPLPGDAMPRCDGIELTPQVVVLDCIPVRGPPLVSFPDSQPFRDALTQVFGIGEQRDVAGFFEGRERRNGGLQFHAIVGRGRVSPSQLT